MYGLAHTMKVHPVIAYELLIYGLAQTLKEHLFIAYMYF